MSELSVGLNSAIRSDSIGRVDGDLRSGNSSAAQEKLGADFREALTRASQPTTNASPVSMSPTNSIGGLKWSGHAVERMKSRGIQFAPDMMKNIESAVAKAAGKGAKDTLVLAGDNALIVSVKNNTVVTVMDRAAMRENVFTNIDSTVVI